MVSSGRVRSFLIYAPSYDENSGGIVVLHLLCHYLRELGEDAYLVPHFANEELNVFNYQPAFQKLIDNLEYLSTYQVIPEKNVAVFIGNPLDIHVDDVVVYPETTFGNPLSAVHVTRWLLHNPGFFTRKVFFTADEVQFRYAAVFRPIAADFIDLSDDILKIIHIPTHIYRNESVGHTRAGTAYCLRKGRGQPLVHDLRDSELIDDLPHHEIAALFNRIETFISYDTDTLYSWLAPLCGARSVIIPDPRISPEREAVYKTYPGIAYGFDDLERATRTLPDLFAYFDNIEEENRFSTRKFAEFWSDRIGHVSQGSSQIESAGGDNANPNPHKRSISHMGLLEQRDHFRQLANIDEIVAENRELREALRLMDCSLSWRLTSPLRWAKHRLDRLRKKR